MVHRVLDRARPCNLVELGLGMTEWRKFSYEDGFTLWQTVCWNPGCDRGLLLSPARFCPICKGTGYIVSSTDPTIAVTRWPTNHE